MNTSHLIRPLTTGDAAAYHRLRLRSLQEHPAAFGTAYEDERNVAQETVATRLQATPDHFVLGAWQATTLVGIAAFSRSPRVKLRHRGGIGGMYVVPEAQGRGIGRALLAAVIDRARTMPHLEEILLAVTVGNEAARALYLAAGFTPSHVEKRYIKLADQYYDIEWMTYLLQ